MLSLLLRLVLLWLGDFMVMFMVFMTIYRATINIIEVIFT